MTKNQCQLLEEAVERYTNIIQTKNRKVKSIYYPLSSCFDFANESFLGYLNNLEIELNGPCDDTLYPFYGMDEECEFFKTLFDFDINFLCFFQTF